MQTTRVETTRRASGAINRQPTTRGRQAAQ
jgi:hypothetical protein